MKTKELYLLDQAVSVYANLKGFPGEDGEPNKKHDFEARYRSGRLLKSLRPVMEELEGQRQKLIEEFYQPVDPKNPKRDQHGREVRSVIPEKKKEADDAFKAFNEAEHDVTLHRIKKLDIMHPDVTGEMMAIFETCGIITDDETPESPSAKP